MRHVLNITFILATISVAAVQPARAGRLLNARLCAMAVGGPADEGPRAELAVKQHVDLLDVAYVGGRLREIDSKLEEATRQHGQILANYETLATNFEKLREDLRRQNGLIYVEPPKWKFWAPTEVDRSITDATWVNGSKTAIVELEQHVKRITILLNEHRELSGQWRSILAQGLVDNKTMIDTAERSLEKTLEESEGKGNPQLYQTALVEADQLKSTRQGQAMLRHMETNDLVQDLGLDVLVRDRLIPSLLRVKSRFEALLL